MRTAICNLEGVTPISFGRYHGTPKLDAKESSAAYEERVWRERVHYDDNGRVFVTPMMIKNSLSETAKFLSIQVPGKGKATFTKHFEAGILVMDRAFLLPEVLKDNLQSERLHVPADGRRGGTTRVEKIFPIIHKWSLQVPIHILDETISPKVFEEHLGQCGQFVGLGRFRPRMNGYYGRFNISKLEWK